jgi:hypothetical protein
MIRRLADAMAAYGENAVFDWIDPFALIAAVLRRRA